MATDANKALVRRFFEEYSFDVIDELFIPAYTTTILICRPSSNTVATPTNGILARLRGDLNLG